MLSYAAPSHGTLEVFSDGSFDYTPNTGYVGPDTFSYTAANGTISSTTTDTIEVYHAAPVAVPDLYTMQAGTALSLDAASGLLANDIDFNTGTLQVLSYSAPNHGTLDVSCDGSVRYIPNPGFVGQEVSPTRKATASGRPSAQSPSSSPTPRRSPTPTTTPCAPARP